MSAPAFAWAIEQGCAQNLKPAERLVLLYLADKANGARVCWPGQETIKRFTGLALRTIREVLPRLAKVGLIRIEAHVGRPTVYHILREDSPIAQQDTPANRHGVTPANGNGVASPTPAECSGVTPANGASDPGKPFSEPRQTVAPNLKKNQEENLERARAREGEGFKNSRVGKEAAPPPTEPKPEREPTLAEIEASRRSQLEAIAQMPGPLADAVRHLANAVEHKFHGPGRWPELTRETQAEAVAPPRTKANHISSDRLAAFRADLASRATAVQASRVGATP